MAYQSQFYTAGTVTVTDGSAIVTGSDTGWETALIEGGVFYVLGSAYPILSVEDETKLTLAIPFSGEGAAGLAYAIDRQRSAAVSSIAMNDRLAAIIASIHGSQPESDLLSAFAALQGEDGKLAMFTSGNTLSLVDYIADAKGSLAKLAALALAADQLLITNADGNMAGSAISATGKLLAAMAGSASEYLRADGTKANVSTLPVSSATQTALNAKANLGGASFTGDVLANGANVRAQYPRTSSTAGQVNTAGTLQSRLTNTDMFTNLVLQETVGSYVQAVLHVSLSSSDQAFFTFRHNGAMSVPGALSKGSGTFLIDHPLDPYNKNLRHGFVEAPRYDLIYRGTVRLVGGRAQVDIDAASNMTSGTFAALTTNAIVTSLQNQDGFARLKPGPISGGSFEIVCEDESSNDLVSWVVIAERNDQFVKSDLDTNTDSDGRFVPEFEKED